MTVRIDSIKIGERHRKDMGDIAGLAASIESVGLLHPVVVTPAGELIAGERRLEACRKIGWADVPVTVVDLAEVVRGEFAENMVRKAFTPTEEVAIYRAMAPEEKEAAAERARSRTDLRESFPPDEAGRTRDKVGAYVGKSGRTLEKQVAIVEAAEAEPERFGNLVADMDRTGRVDGPYKRLKVARQAEAIAKEPPPLPGEGPYRVIVADPPWPYEIRKADPSHRAAHPYPQMSIADIMALDVGAIAHKDCLLFLWTTNHHLREAFGILDAWGFAQKTMLTWVKHKMGMGDWLRGKTEHCLLAVRGKPTVVIGNHTTALMGTVRANSQKPEEFYAFVESYAPAPRYAELFQRTGRMGWDGHGDEAG